MVFMYAPDAPPDPDSAEVLHCSFLSLIWIPGSSPERRSRSQPSAHLSTQPSDAL